MTEKVQVAAVIAAAKAAEAGLKAAAAEVGPQTCRTHPHAEHSGHHHYVSVIDGPRHGLLLGPYATRQEAGQNVERAATKAREVNDDAIWFGFGTCRVTTSAPKAGRFNDLIGMTA